MESGNKECQQQYIQVGIDEKSFHFIHVFVLKTFSNSIATKEFIQRLNLLKRITAHVNNVCQHHQATTVA